MYRPMVKREDPYPLTTRIDRATVIDADWDDARHDEQVGLPLQQNRIVDVPLPAIFSNNSAPRP